MVLAKKILFVGCTLIVLVGIGIWSGKFIGTISPPAETKVFRIDDRFSVEITEERISQAAVLQKVERVAAGLCPGSGSR